MTTTTTTTRGTARTKADKRRELVARVEAKLARTKALHAAATGPRMAAHWAAEVARLEALLDADRRAVVRKLAR